MYLANSNQFNNDRKSDEEADTIRQSHLLYQWVPRVMNAMERIPRKKYLTRKVRQSFVKFVQIDCGQNYSIGLSETGEVYICGEGITGVISQGTLFKRNLKVINQ